MACDCDWDGPRRGHARAFASPSLEALWFAGCGLAVVLIGALTLLARSVRARKVVRVATGANAAGLALAVTFGVLTGWTEPQGPFLAAVFLLGGLAVGWRRSSLAHRLP